MILNNLLLLFFIVFLLFLSGVFSGCETAFFSLDKKNKNDILSGKIKNKTAKIFLEQPNYLLVTLLFGNMLVNITLSTLTEGFFHDLPFLILYDEKIKIIISIIAATTILLLFGEILPKIIAINTPIKIINIFSPLIYSISIIIHPFKIILFKLSKKTHDFFYDIDENTITDDELIAIVNAGFKEGAVTKDELSLIQNVINFADKEVKHIMTPRTKIFALENTLKPSEFISQAKESGYSKILIFSGSKDNIIGVIFLKDIIKHIINPNKLITDLDKYINKTYFVHEKKPLLELLKELRHNRLKVAIVIDEYGGTSGLVTIYDIIHKITGRFFEEDSPLDSIKIEKINDNNYSCKGDATLEELNQVIGLKIIDEDHQTISGFLIEKLDKIPSKEDKVIFNNMIFTIKEMDARTISIINIEIPLNKEKRLGNIEK